MANRRPTLLLILLPIIFVVGFLIFLPLSNFFLPRNKIEVTGGIPEFKTVSAIMQTKCVDCHTPGMASLPIYAKFPIADKLINDDIARAQKEIVFDKDRLAGKTPFSRMELARIQSVIDDNQMPIAEYLWMHWDGSLDQSEKQAFLDWIKAQAIADSKPVE